MTMRSPIHRGHILPLLCGVIIGALFIIISNKRELECNCKDASRQTGDGDAFPKVSSSGPNRILSTGVFKNDHYSNILLPSFYDDDRNITALHPPLKVIPPILHLQWKDRRLPIFTHPHLKEWHRLHPSWEIVLWTDKDIERLFKLVLGSNSPWYKNIKTFSHHIMRVDFARYLILYLYGGTYSDIDNLPLKSLEPMLQHHSCVIAREPESYNVGVGMPASSLLLSNILMASAPGHPFWLMLMEKLKGRKKAHPIVQIGPVAMSDIIREIGTNIGLAGPYGAVFVAPAMYFYPLNKPGGDERHKALTRSRCPHLMRMKTGLSSFARKVCNELMTKNTLNSEAGVNHPRAFNGSFSKHTQFTSWGSDSASKQIYRDINVLPFPVHTPDHLLQLPVLESAFDRELRVLNGQLS